MSTTLPAGHSIPYHFTAAEAKAFLARHTASVAAAEYHPKLVTYLQTNYPPWGVVVNEAYGEILVYQGARGLPVHVVDVTNMNIAKSVQQAPYESPGSSLVTNLEEELKALFKKAFTVLQWLTVAAVAIAAIFALTKWKR